jgi:putative acyl-CoA dehydrogenase
MSYDRYGNRVDEVRFHPSWHWLASTSYDRVRRRPAPWQAWG